MRELPAGQDDRRELTPRQYVEVPYQGYGTTEHSGDEEHGGLLEYLRILQRRRGTLILIAFIGAVVGFLATLPQTPVYQAKTTVEVLDINNDFMNMRQANPVQEGVAAYSAVPTMVKLLQSTSLIEKVVDRLKAGTPEKISLRSDRISAWRRALNLKEPVAEEAHELAVKTAVQNLKVRGGTDTRIVEITVDSTDPQVAASFANALTGEFIDNNLEARWKTTQHTGEWLQRQLDDMRIKLERAEEQMNAYSRRAGLMVFSEKSPASEDKLRQLQDALTKAQADRMAKQARFELAKSSPPETLADILNDPNLRDYQSKLTTLRGQYAELSVTFTAEMPRVKRVQTQIKLLEAAELKERSAILARIKNDYDEAMTHERLLSVDYGKQTGIVGEDAEKSVQYNILKREVETYRQLYETMLQRVKEAGIQSAMRASNVRVVDPAKPPRLPYKPQIIQSSGVGLLAGLFLGAVFVVMRERADRTLQDPVDVAYYLNLPELGVIPSAEMASSRKLYYRKKGDRKSLALQTTKESPNVEMVTRQQGSSMIAESFRATLTSILFSGQGGKRPRVLVMTSPNPSEGKTTVTSNLAQSLAEVDQRVLLIDGDMRKPRQHDIHGVSNERGLTDLLRMVEPLSGQVMDRLIQATGVQNVHVLPSGPPTAAASNLLHSKRLAELLQWAGENYDTVLVDAPPILLIPDARVLGKIADAVILVVRAHQTTRDAGLAARQRLVDDGTPVLGTVFNDYNPKKSTGYGAGYGYGARYGYKSYYRTET